jgi:beta-catenin-like protein 1
VRSRRIKSSALNIRTTLPSPLITTLVHLRLTPGRFIDSEADLDVAIKTLLPLSQAPSLAYPEMVRFGTTETLVGLLSHENTDIVIDVVEVVHELTDEDVGDEDLDVDEDDENKEAPLKTLIDGLVCRLYSTTNKLSYVLQQAYSILELLVDNLGRFKEEEDVDRQGLFHVLGELCSPLRNTSYNRAIGIFENIIGFNPQLSSHLVDKTALMKWLLSRIQAKTHDGNRGYVAELLVILLQNNRHNRAKFAAADGIEILLTVAAVGFRCITFGNMHVEI